MRLEFFWGISIVFLIVLGSCIRVLLRREVLIHVLFTFAVISYLFRHLTGSRTV
ncbi:MAG TPA: hypothetical protein VHX36_15260 [Candidatus Acidoferrales bacterium]|jgi:hypothetical protein|nr:hypothetical protein [Candidatus Acidoferrales bacterium]